jgi:tripartite-type tricarboxylate transporter receptor subunit TctC
MKRRYFSAAVAIGTVLSALMPAAQAQSQAYPTRPIKFILGHAPGGGADQVARALAKPLAERLGQPVVVENRPGANQIIAAELAAKAPADGYTIYLASQSSLVLNVGARKSLPYDSLKDFAPVSLVYTIPLYLVVNNDVPAKTVTELISYAKANPGKLGFASIGTGSSVHLAAEMFKSMAGIDMLHVPYRGSNDGLLDVMAGRVQLMFDGGVTALPQVKAGKLRVLGMTGSERSKSAPDVPTIAEAGLPGYVATFWFGVVAPAGTPKPIIDRLSTEVRAILDQPSFSQPFAAAGLDIKSSTPEAFAEQLRRDLPTWVNIMKTAGIVPE